VKNAPVFVDAYEANLTLHRALAGDASPVGARACALGSDLVDAVAFALKGWDTREELDAADALLARLRLAVRLLGDLGTLPRPQQLSVAERLDCVGRQLGGWRRSLGMPR